MVFEGEDTEATDIAGLSFVVFTPILAPAIPWEIPDLVVVAVQGAPLANTVSSSPGKSSES
jgi:hypothetical protein